MRFRIVRRVGLAKLAAMSLPVFAAFGLALPAPAGAWLYWTTTGSGDNIARASLTGRTVEQSFLTSPFAHGNLQSLAVGGSYIYFGGVQGLIGRANLQGGNVDPDVLTIPQPVPENPFEPTGLNAISIAVSGGYIYWCTGGTAISKERAEDAIGRARVDGGGVEADFIKTETPVYGVRVYDGHLYWLSENAIARADIDGSGVEPEFIPLQRLPTNANVSFAVAEGHIYWATEHSIVRADIARRSVDTQFITGLGSLGGVTFADGDVYWVEGTPGGSSHPRPTWIGRATSTGTGIRKQLISFLTIPARSEIPGALVADALGPSHRRPPRRAQPRRPQRGR